MKDFWTDTRVKRIEGLVAKRAVRLHDNVVLPAVREQGVLHEPRMNLDLVDHRLDAAGAQQRLQVADRVVGNAGKSERES